VSNDLRIEEERTQVFSRFRTQSMLGQQALNAQSKTSDLVTLFLNSQVMLTAAEEGSTL